MVSGREENRVHQRCRRHPELRSCNLRDECGRHRAHKIDQGISGGSKLWIRRPPLMVPELLGNTDRFVVNSDGTHEERLTMTLDTAEIAGSWSRDGKSLFFSYFDYTRTDSNGTLLENFRIARIDLERRSVVDLSPIEDVDSGPVNSPDDSLIAFSSLVSFSPGAGLARQLYLMSAGGSGKRKLTGNDYRNEDPVAWSRDGSRILYNAQNDQLLPYQNPPRDILIIGSEGGLTRKDRK